MMKKMIYTISLCFLICIFTACGKNKIENEAVVVEEYYESIDEEFTGNADNVEAIQENRDNLVNIPNMGYEATLNDVDGNVLFAYYVPLGWGKEDGPIYSDYASATLERSVDGIFAQSVIIECRKNKGYIDLYETGEVNSQYLDVSDGQIYTYDGDVKTPYGNFKFYNLDEQGEYGNDRELAIFQLNEKWCVIISISTTDYMRSSVYEYLKDIVLLLLSEKEEIISVEQEFDYYLQGINDEKVFGFNIPSDMKIGEWTDDKKVWLENETCQIWITEIQYHMTLPTYGCDIYSYTYDWKDSIETIYGIANIYECSVCEKVAILKVNGHYIEIMYRTQEESNIEDLVNILKSDLLADFLIYD